MQSLFLACELCVLFRLNCQSFLCHICNWFRVYSRCQYRSHLLFLHCLIFSSSIVYQILTYFTKLQLIINRAYTEQKYLADSPTDENTKVAKIIFSMSASFLTKFFDLSLPEPGQRCLGGVDAKSDLKLLLEIATSSRLKQGQDKKNQNKQIFYCRSLGKDCFKIEVQFFRDGSFQVLDDYTMMKHRESCQISGESPSVIKIYNLMMLKRDLIEKFMEQNGLLDSSPEMILQKISGETGDYFYCQQITDLESRRKLKKRFDNIINISIKKKKETKVKALELEKIVQEKSQKAHRKGGRNKKRFQEWQDKQNLKILNVIQKDQQVKPSLKELQRIGSQRFKNRLDSNSSINFYRLADNNNDDQKYRIPSEVFNLRNDSIFESEEEDYFRKKSDLYIKMNMLNDVGSNNFWPDSEHSIGGNSDRVKVDDLFASLIRNSLIRSIDKKSLTDIEPNPNDPVANSQDNN